MTWPAPLGSRWRTRIDFNAVPKGTTCTVVEHYGGETMDNTYKLQGSERPPLTFYKGVMVEWDRPQDVAARQGKPPVIGPAPKLTDPRGHGLRDGFSQEEVEAFLEPEA